MKKYLWKSFWVLSIALFIAFIIPNVEAKAADTTPPVIDKLEMVGIYNPEIINGVKVTAHDSGGSGLGKVCYYKKSNPSNVTSYDWYEGFNYAEVGLGDEEWNDPNLYGVYCFYVIDKAGNKSAEKEIDFKFQGVQHYGAWDISYPKSVSYYLSNGKKQPANIQLLWSVGNMNWINNQDPIFEWKNLKCSNTSIATPTVGKAQYGDGNNIPYLVLTGKTGTFTISGDVHCVNFPEVFRGTKSFSTKITVIDDTKKSTKKITVGKPNVSLKLKGKKVTVKWKKCKNAKKYIVQYADNKKFKNAKSKTLSSKKTSFKFNKKSKKKKYYVKVYAVNGNNKVVSKVKKK